MPTPPDKLRFLILTADPKDHPQPALGAEFEILRDELQSRHPKRVRIDRASSVTPELFADYLTGHRPHVLHFAGHGNNRGEPYLLDADDAGRPASVRALRSMLAQATDLRCVVLNACNSARVAQHLSLDLPVVTVGHSAAVDDAGLRQFAGRLYRGVALGRSVAQAVRDARTVLAAHPDIDAIGQVNARYDVDSEEVVLLPDHTGAGSVEDLHALALLLRSLFQPDEFRRFLKRHHETAELLEQIATTTTPADLFASVTELLAGRGLLDRAFFDRLEAERSRRTDILPMRQRFGH